MRLLLAEDEPSLGAQIQAALGGAGYAVDWARDGEEAWFQGDGEPYDAVVLDLGLPGLDGLQVLKRWRAAGRAMPVLVLTARGTWADKVEGLDAGADDYLAKPFRMEELLARLRSLIRRAARTVEPVLRCGPVELDPRSGRVAVGGAPVTLTSHEYRVLAYLMHHPGRVVSRGELIEHIYAQDHDRDSNTIEVFVARLRRKLGVAVIRTIRGLGYRLEEG
ncbi:MAG: response regulator transcription factor [Alphaproteobacteria bacterium]|nr:response regulator transcription factor [Alphaproteobacteria bacterium]